MICRGQVGFLFDLLGCSAMSGFTSQASEICSIITTRILSFVFQFALIAFSCASRLCRRAPSLLPLAVTGTYASTLNVFPNIIFGPLPCRRRHPPPYTYRFQQTSETCIFDLPQESFLFSNAGIELLKKRSRSCPLFFLLHVTS